MASSSGDGSSLFGGFAGKVTEQVVRGKVSATERLADHYIRVAMAAQEAFFSLTGSEVKRTFGPIMEQVADHPDAPEWLRTTADFLARGHGQWQTLLAGGAMGAAFGSGLTNLLTNEMTPVIAAIIAANPHIRLPVDQLAMLKIRNLTDQVDAVYEARGQGIDEPHFAMLQELLRPTLTVDQVIELANRGEINDAAVKHFMTRNGYDDVNARLLASLKRTYISLPDASQMWNRNLLTTDQVYDLAEKQGYTRGDADAYMGIGGVPPAPEILYEAFRRGFIDEARLQRDIVQGPIRPEWFDVIKAVQFHPMTPEQAAGAVNQNLMPEARARDIAKAYGLDPDDMSTLIEGAGRPPGVALAAEARRRGFLTPEQWRQAYFESYVKNKYVDLLEKMLVEIPPQGTVRELLRSGSITQERATQILQFLGLEDDIIAAMVDEATRTKQAATRDLTRSAVTDLYEEQEIDRDTAVTMLTDLGYDVQEANWLLGLADFARLRTTRNAIVAKVQSGFVKGLTSTTDASATLDSVGIPAARRDELIALWTIEQQTITRDLTPAQLVAAAKKNIVDPQTALARLVGQGYAQQDAVTLLAISGVTA